MKHRKLFITNFMMAALSIYNQVSALMKESIVGGYRAEINFFKYLIEIRGRKNFSPVYEPGCGGALLSDLIAISAAHCFMDENGNLAQFTFSVKAATDIFNDSNALYVDIDIIYRLQVYEIVYFNDIALAKLKHEIGIKRNKKLGTLKLPQSKKSFRGSTGTIAGFGYHWVVYKKNSATGLKERSNAGHFDNYLRYALVKIYTYDMKSYYSNNTIENMIMGVIIPEESKTWGTCTGDSGNALVVDNIVVGILVASPVHCDDTIEGSIYLKVSTYLDFIRGVMTGVLTKDTLTFLNHPHIDSISK